MNASEAGQVLTLIAGVDNRTFDGATCRIWADALDGLDLDDCLDAVRLFRRQTRDWLTPFDVRERARTVILERRRVDAEHAERLAIERANDDPTVCAERAEMIRRLVGDACKIPAEPSPHPPQDTLRTRKAREVVCPWCKATAGAACVNTATGRPTGVTHEARLVAAGLSVAPSPVPVPA